ncbi:MAG: hypothetical protein EA349_06190 [Halomonadaceae bacterium]|nr:MAG: hypothetical protein EA349_06190 [Halomonadaceae bacterium]
MGFPRYLSVSFLVASLLLAISLPAQAEPGDYRLLQTLRHLVSPPKADNPVTPAQRQDDYPLISNPRGFKDGFSPGRYSQWQTVHLAPETGAVCGNGSPYKFFVNRVPGTSNTILYMEGGGACWDYESCTGQTGIRGARNPNGVPDDYMSILNPEGSFVSPFVARYHPFDRVKTQAWNMVYVPYCTGDVFSGDRVAVYEDPTGEKEPLVWHHNGLRNGRAVVAWMKDNLQRPTQLLSTGCSAGGVGSLNNYYPNRRDLAPEYGYLINDSGPVFPAPVSGNKATYPSLPLHQKIRAVWGLDDGALDYIRQEMPLFNEQDLGSINPALATAFPRDRLGHTHFWQDLNFSAYSYERFHDETDQAPDQATLEQGLHQRWHQDTGALITQLAGLDNFGYYLPAFRNINESHCSTIIDFKNGDIPEMGLTLKDFINDVLDGSGSVMQAAASDPKTDENPRFNLLYWIVDGLL